MNTGDTWSGTRVLVSSRMLADANVVILLVWFAIEAIPLLANRLADWESELRRKDRHD